MLNVAHNVFVSRGVSGV